MFKKLNLIKNIQTEIIGNNLIIQNSNKHKTNIAINNIKSIEVVISSSDEKGFKIIFENNNFLIVTTDDFIFNTQNFGSIVIENLPEIVSLNDIIASVGKYIKDPEPDNNIDNTVALYLFNKTLIENAECNNFDIADLKQKVREAAINTSSIDDLTIYD